MINSKRAFKIEKMIAEYLSFKRVAGSGSQWHSKEDIKSEKYLGQIKATDTKKGNFNVEDLSKLERNAIKENKKPIYIVHFEREELINSTWVTMPIEKFKEMIKKGET